MSGAARVEVIVPVLFPRSFPLAQLLFDFPVVVLWRIDSVDRTMVPDDIASAHIAVHPFLLSTFLASDSS